MPFGVIERDLPRLMLGFRVPFGVRERPGLYLVPFGVREDERERLGFLVPLGVLEPDRPERPCRLSLADRLRLRNGVAVPEAR